MTRIRVTNLAAVGIIYPASDPAVLFIERKDSGHPAKLVHGQLCFPGGNWIGDVARGDHGPRETFCREIGEELSTEELVLLGSTDHVSLQTATSIAAVRVRQGDKDDLEAVKTSICATARPWRDYLNTVPKEVLDAANPAKDHRGFVVVVSYFLVPLGDSIWEKLVALQERFGNLSNEAETTIISLREIVATGQKTAFAHDWALRDFFQLYGLPVAQFPMVEGLTGECVGSPFASYEESLKSYDVQRFPWS